MRILDPKWEVLGIQNYKIIQIYWHNSLSLRCIEVAFVGSDLASL